MTEWIENLHWTRGFIDRADAVNWLRVAGYEGKSNEHAAPNQSHCNVPQLELDGRWPEFGNQVAKQQQAAAHEQDADSTYTDRH